jgi:hypothetical protein
MASGKPYAHKEPLTVGSLINHFVGVDGWRCGLYTTSLDNTSLWFGIDIDAHANSKVPADPEQNRRYALALYAKLRELGLHILLEDSNGQGGYHIWVFFDQPIPTAIVYAFGKWLIRTVEWSAFKLPKAPELFPKQSSVPAGEFGNWLRLPGLHPKHRHLSKVWSGDRWLEADDAIHAILSMPPNSSDLIPGEAIVAAQTEEPAKERATTGERVAAPRSPGDGLTPLEHFEACTEWFRDILEPHGWKTDREADGVIYLTRPGKDSGCSATLGYCMTETGEPLLHVFTNNADPLVMDKTYTKFGAWTALVHNGDAKAAGKWLYENGFGTYACLVREDGRKVVRQVSNPRPTAPPPDTPPPPDADAIAARAMELMGTDRNSAALFRDTSTIDQLARLMVADVAQFEAVRQDLKRAGVSVGALDRAVHATAEKLDLVGEGGFKETQAEALLRLAEDAELARTPAGRTHARVPVEDHHEVFPIRSSGFRLWLTKRYRDEHGRPPAAEALQSAVRALNADATFGKRVEQVYVRVAPGPGDSILIDLGDATRRVVHVDPDNPEGWELVEPQVWFTRPPGMLALPMPEWGEEIDKLRDFLNVSDDAFTMVVAWLIHSLRCRGPFAELVFQGEAGSAKTTTAELVRRLIDPYIAGLRSPPRDSRDLWIAATNSWVVAFDNISTLPDWLSDDLCRVASGGGFGTRTLYKDDEEFLFDGERPVILAGIDDFVRRGDLTDRCVFVELKPIDDSKRRRDEELKAAFEKVHGQLFGAVLTLLSHSLRIRRDVTLDKLPRMADFALTGEATCQARGQEAGTFLAVYKQNRSAAVEAALDDSLVARALREFITPGSQWTGKASELLDELNSRFASLAQKKGWPTGARGLSGQLRRLAPLLRTAGLNIQVPEATDKTRSFSLSAVKVAEQPPEPPEPPTKQPAGSGTSGGRNGAPTQPPEQPPTSSKLAEAPQGGSGGLGGQLPNVSGNSKTEDDREVYVV